MDCLKLTLTLIDPNTINDENTELLWDYLSCLYKNGQILKDYQLLQNDDKIDAYVTVPDDYALDEKNNNIYVNEYLEKVHDIFHISSEKVGVNLNCEKESCSCPSPSWYVLYTDFTCIESPVVCGDCGKTVPLYRLPHILNEKEHHGLLGWQETYKNMDDIWMYCLSDRFTYRQLNDCKSQLSKIGRNICEEFEKATGKPFYYYLFQYKKSSKKCPACGNDWESLEDAFIDYRCPNCRLCADEV